MSTATFTPTHTITDTPVEVVSHGSVVSTVRYASGTAVAVPSRELRLLDPEPLVDTTVGGWRILVWPWDVRSVKVSATSGGRVLGCVVAIGDELRAFDPEAEWAALNAETGHECKAWRAKS